MKNPAKVHMLPTDKVLSKNEKSMMITLGEWGVGFGYQNGKHQHLYFTTDEEIKEGDWFMCISAKGWIPEPIRCGGVSAKGYRYAGVTNHYTPTKKDYAKIVATTNPELWRCDKCKGTGEVEIGNYAFTTYVNCSCNKGNHKGIAKIGENFIEYFIKKQGKIEEVFLDYNSHRVLTEGGGVRIQLDDLKLNPDNTVTVIWDVEEEKKFTKQDMERAWANGVIWGDANCEMGGETNLPKFNEWFNETYLK